MLASRHDHGNIVTLLLLHGARPRATTSESPRWKAGAVAAASHAPHALSALFAHATGAVSLPSAVHQAVRRMPPLPCGCACERGCGLCTSGVFQQVLERDADNLAVIALLVREGADLNRASRGVWTPLANAALSGDVTIAQALIGAGATVDALTRIDGLLAVVVCADRNSGNDAEMTRLLLTTHDADGTEWPDSELVRALRAAIELGSAACIAALAAKVALDAPYVAGGHITPVLDAVARGQSGVGALQALLSAGAQPEPFAPRCWPSALQHAVRHGCADAVTLLIVHGAPAGTVSPRHGCTAAQLAASMDRRDLAQMLQSAENDAMCDGRHSTSAIDTVGSWTHLSTIAETLETLESDDLPISASAERAGAADVSGQLGRSQEPPAQPSVDTACGATGLSMCHLPVFDVAVLWSTGETAGSHTHDEPHLDTATQAASKCDRLSPATQSGDTAAPVAQLLSRDRSRSAGSTSFRKVMQALRKSVSLPTRHKQ